MYYNISKAQENPPGAYLRNCVTKCVNEKFTFQLITGFQFTFGIARFVIAGFTVMADTTENS